MRLVEEQRCRVGSSHTHGVVFKIRRDILAAEVPLRNQGFQLHNKAL